MKLYTLPGIVLAGLCSIGPAFAEPSLRQLMKDGIEAASAGDKEKLEKIYLQANGRPWSEFSEMIESTPGFAPAAQLFVSSLVGYSPHLEKALSTFRAHKESAIRLCVLSAWVERHSPAGRKLDKDGLLSLEGLTGDHDPIVAARALLSLMVATSPDDPKYDPLRKKIAARLTSIKALDQFTKDLITYLEPRDGVALPNGTSPDKKYEVILEAEKNTPRYKRYEFKGGEEQRPAFLIREVKTGKIAARVKWMGDPHSYEAPLRSHSTVLWRPSGSTVILNTTERFYAHSSIWTLDPASGKFTELVLPDYKELTGFEVPSPDDLRARGFSSSSWTKEGDLVYKLILSPLKPKEDGDPYQHRITLRMGPKGFKVIAREELEE